MTPYRIICCRFNSPHNPSGKVFSAEERELVARLCIQHDVIAVCDEVCGVWGVGVGGALVFTA